VTKFVAKVPTVVPAEPTASTNSHTKFFVMFLALILFLLSLSNIKKHDGVIGRDHRCSGQEDCSTELQKSSKSKILRLNLVLAIVSLAFSLALIFSLQFGKRTGGAKAAMTMLLS